MKKLLLLAAIGLLATSSASAFGSDQENDNGSEQGQTSANSCTACGNEDEISTDISVCSSVRVPLCVLVEDATITFPCLRRPLTSYATHHTDGWASDWTIDPVNPNEQISGNTARVRVQGDADDEVMASILQSANIVGNKIYVQHVNTAGQFSTGPHGLPASGTGTNPDYMIVTLKGIVTQTTPGFIVDQNQLDGYNGATSPFPGEAISSSGAFVGPNSSVAGSYSLSHNDGSGFLGTGGLVVYLGGSVAVQVGQQRGQYTGNFKVKFFYAQ